MSISKNEVKKFIQFINEDLEQTTDMMSNSVNVYKKYKNKVVSGINKEDIGKSEEDFNKFIESLPDNEREASDMLRSLFTSEAMKIKIESLEKQKIEIEEQISVRIKELKDIQSNLG
jgi:hypothetical protein